MKFKNLTNLDFMGKYVLDINDKEYKTRVWLSSKGHKQYVFIPV